MARSDAMTPQSTPTSTGLEQYPRIVAAPTPDRVDAEGTNDATQSTSEGVVSVDPAVVRGPELDTVLRDAAAGGRGVHIASDDMAAVVAVTALAAKAGVRTVVTSCPDAARDAADMVASIERRRPPARTVRGLA